MNTQFMVGKSISYAQLRPQSTVKTLRFAASSNDSAPSVAKEAAELRKKQDAFMSKVVYERDGECLTGFDILKAIQDAGTSAVIKPWVSLNPVKWVQWSYAAATGDGFSSWVQFAAVVNKLPLKYKKRGKLEQDTLDATISNVLDQLAKLELVHYGDSSGHFTEVWRPGARGKQLLKTYGAQNRYSKSQRVPQEQTDIKTRFEQQVRELQTQQRTRIGELQRIVLQYQEHEKHYGDLQKALQERERIHDDLTQKRKQRVLSAKETETYQTLEDQIGLLSADVKNKKELLETLKLQVSYAETVTRELNQQTTQYIARIRETLSRIEINKVNANILQMSGRLKERADLEQELNDQLEDANRAYITLRTAMESNNPDAYLKAMKILNETAAPAAANKAPAATTPSGQEKSPTTVTLSPEDERLLAIQALENEADNADKTTPQSSKTKGRGNN